MKDQELSEKNRESATPSAPKEIREELELAKKERDEYLNGWKRAKADLANFRKETEQAITKLADVLRVELLKSLLPVVDSFEESAKSKAEGLAEIRSLFLLTLKKDGLEEIKVEPGEEFNPEIHEAVDGEGERIGEIVRKGYRYKDYIIRPAKVKLNK